MSAIEELLVTSGLAVRDVAAPEVHAVYLHAGQLHVSPEPVQITTILGSCLAMCVWDEASGVGGMNHYMLPQDVGVNCNTPRYAKFAIRQLFDELLFAGARRSRLQARLFGGACVMASFQANGFDLGSRNVQVARQFLEDSGIPIVSEDVGGTHGRKVVFRTDTGLAMVRRV